MNIGLDLDGVLAEFHESWLRYHNKKYHTNFALEDITSYDLCPILKITERQVIERFFDFFNSESSINIAPIPGSVEAVKELAKRDELSVITSRPYEVHEQTSQWLQRHYPETIEKVICTNQISFKGSSKILKSNVCTDNNIDIFVEDAILHANDIVETNTPVILMNKPWNLKDKLTEGITRVDTWEDAVKEIKRLKKNQSRGIKSHPSS